MTKPSLSQTFRHGLPADATGAVAALLRDLEPASARLARDLAVLHAPAHPGRAAAHAARTAAGARRREAGWQWGALAACLIAGIALWAARGHVSPLATESALAQSPLRGDRIFTWATPQVASHRQAASDRIFSSDEGARDRIFDARFGGG
mgnify:FL=1